MSWYEIRREPGAAARRSAGGRFTPSRLMAEVEAASAKDALASHVGDWARSSKQVIALRYEWQSVAAMGDRWNRDDGRDSAGRRWRAIVTLRNGINVPHYGSGLIGCEEIDLSHPVMKQVPA